MRAARRGRSPPARPRRAALSLVEIVVALAVMGLGLLPVLDLFGGARATLSRGREVLELQARALEALTRVRAEIGRGDVRGLGSEGRVEREVDVGGVLVRTEIAAVPRKKIFTVRVRVEGPARFFELGQVVAYPGGSYLDRSVGER